MFPVEVNYRVVVLAHLTLHFEVYSIPMVRYSDPEFLNILSHTLQCPSEGVCFSMVLNCLEFLLYLCRLTHKIFTEEKSASEKGTSFAEMNRSACSNAKQGPTKQYNAFKDFHDSETIAHILVAWMQFTGINGIEGFRKIFVYHLFY